MRPSSDFGSTCFMVLSTREIVNVPVELSVPMSESPETSRFNTRSSAPISSSLRADSSISRSMSLVCWPVERDSNTIRDSDKS